MGRPRKFDRAQAVEEAMRIFWRHGYDGTSLDDLLHELKITNSSFYQAFASKEQLFIESLGLYRQTMRKERLAALARRSGSAKANLKKYFRRFIFQGPEHNCPVGCFMAQTTALFQDSGSLVGQTVEESMKNLELVLGDFLTWGQSTGEFSKKLDIKKTSKLLVATLYGTTIVARVKKNKQQLLRPLYVFVDMIAR